LAPADDEFAAVLVRGRDPIERAGQEIVVAVDVREQVAGRALETLVDRVALPRSFSLHHHVSRSAYLRMMSTLPSVDPPSQMMYSRFG
jgi:hypothetical protein